MIEIYDVFWSNNKNLAAIGDIMEGFYPSTQAGSYCYRIEKVIIPAPYAKYITPGDYLTYLEEKFSKHYVVDGGILKILKTRLQVASSASCGFSPVFTAAGIQEYEMTRIVESTITNLNNELYLDAITEQHLAKQKDILEECFDKLTSIKASRKSITSPLISRLN